MKNDFTPSIISNLGVVFIASEVSDLKAGGVDKDIGENPLPWEGHVLHQPPRLIKYVLPIACDVVLAKLKHTEKWDLTIKVSPSTTLT